MLTKGIDFMEEKRVELEELKNDLIRCIIPYKEDDKEI